MVNIVISMYSHSLSMSDSNEYFSRRHFCELKVQYVDLEEDINKLSLFP